MDFLENVSVDKDTEISSNFSEEKISNKDNRSAFVFITAEIDNGYKAIEDLRKIDEVKEVYIAHGAYDIIAKVSGSSFENLREIIHKRIGNLSSIKSTLTLTII
jgi:DNA-binding Lrp family transcriptional regulator